VLRRYRFESAAALALAGFAAYLVLVVPGQQEQPRGPAPAATLDVRTWPTSTAVPIQTGPTPAAAYVPPRVSSEHAIRYVRSLPSNRTPGLTLGDTIPGTWSAEYRGDGTWMVRVGEPAWLYLEDSNAAMPANIAAINVQGADRARSLR
jgi:hypothetical protein